MAKTTKTAAPPAPQPPYLKHVRLRNVPPLRDVKVDFKPGLNVIIGKNGSGKTNFMKLLSELAQPYGERYRGVGCELTLNGNGHEVKISFRENGPKIPSSPKRIAQLVPIARQSLLAMVSSEKSTVEGDTLFGALSNASTAGAIQIADFIFEVVPIWHGLPTHRLPIVDEGVEMQMINGGSLELVNAGVARWETGSRLVSALLGTIEDMDYVYEIAQKKKSTDSLATVRRFIIKSVDVYLERLNNYLPLYSPLQKVRRSDQFQVYQNTAKDELLIKGLVLEYKIGNDWLPFGALSDGTKRVFYLIGEMVSAAFAFVLNEFVSNEKGTSFLDTNKIILLEEPELGIHPDQLQLLLQLIREVSKEHQVILTTHSPQTLDMLTGQELDRITICEFIPGEGTKMRKLSAAKKAKAKAYLRDKGFLSEFWRFSNLEDPD